MSQSDWLNGAKDVLVLFGLFTVIGAYVLIDIAGHFYNKFFRNRE